MLKHNKIAVVSHDAGGAELISSYIKRHGNTNFKYCLGGPALSVFQRKLGSLENNKLEKLIDDVDLLYVGSGWKTSLEYDAIRIANELQIKSICFLDHWVHYSERFKRDNQETMPSEIWVFDRYAKNIAESAFPTSTISLKMNPYDADLVEEIGSRILQGRNKDLDVHILYVCEPISDFNDAFAIERPAYDEFDALQFFFENINFISDKQKIITLRPHPAENPEKYISVKSKYPWLEFKVPEANLIEDICNADIIVGCHSMAMHVALLAQKRVISVIPVPGIACPLPHREIEMLTKIIERS